MISVVVVVYITLHCLLLTIKVVVVIVYATLHCLLLVLGPYCSIVVVVVVVVAVV